MTRVTVLYSQSLFDVVLQATGTIDGVEAVAAANNIHITDDLTSGQKLIIPMNISTDSDILSYYKAKQIKPATAMNKDDKIIVETPEGISYWAINIDFEIQ